MDRDRTIAAIAAAHVEGRLSVDEWHTRLDKASVASTFGELDELTRDLPVAQTSEPIQRLEVLPRWRRASNWLMTWSGWATVTAVLVLDDILNAPGNPIETPFQHSISPWPLWISVPYGFAVARHSTRKSRARFAGSVEAPRAVENQVCER